jgi:hypothetical protein
LIDFGIHCCIDFSISSILSLGGYDATTKNTNSSH